MNNRTKIIWALILIAVAAAARFVPHMPNAAPITAIAIFGAAVMPVRRAALLTFGARLASDIVLGFFAWPQMIAVYAAHGLGLLFGWLVRRANLSSGRWVAYGIMSGGISAVLFFLITNFALLYSMYPHTWGGILAAYVNGLPFLRGTLLGDIGYSAALFGGYALVSRLASRKVAAKVDSVSV